MTDQVAPAPAVPTLSFRFPGVWLGIRADDEARRPADIRRAVDALVEPGDALANARAKLRRDLESGVAAAAQAGATQLFLGEQVAHGVPVSAYLGVYPGLVVTGAIGTDASKVMDAFVAGLAHTAAAPKGERFRSGDSEVFRTVEVSVDAPASTTAELGIVQPDVLDLLRGIGLPADGTVPERRTLRIHFWMTLAGSKRVILLSFSTNFAGLEAELVALFSSIVSTARFEA